jgi:glucan phosphoethanolaminetransferase (alkaline phosphatase superfamily)
MKDVTFEKKAGPKGKWVKILLFWANWLFVVFLSKTFISPPAGNLDFVVKSVGTFFVAVVMTALIIHFFSRKVIILLIPIIVILALAIAIT